MLLLYELLLFRLLFLSVIWNQQQQFLKVQTSTCSCDALLLRDMMKSSSRKYCRMMTSFLIRNQQQQQQQQYQQHRTSITLFHVTKPHPEEPSTPPSQSHNSILILPHVPTLDTSGLLPPSMYYDTKIINSTFIKSNGIEPKPTCRIQIAWDIVAPSSSSSSSSSHNINAHTTMNEITNDDICYMVSNIQNALDHGMTTFHLKPYIASSSNANQLQFDIYKSLIDQTPQSILEQQSHIIIPLRLEDVVLHEPTTIIDSTKSISTNSVRNHIVALLDRLGTDCLDSIQIQFHNLDTTNYHQNNHNNLRMDDRYYFDLIYELQELVRDGYIRSISTKDLTASMYQHIQMNQLHTLLHTNQMDYNLCNVSPLLMNRNNVMSSSSSSLSNDPYTRSNNDDSLWHIPHHMVAANPLAGGWLTDRYCYYGSQQRLQHFDSTWFRTLPSSERWNWDRNIVQSWMTTRNSIRQRGGSASSRNDIDSQVLWNIYQTELMKPLRNIAQKHGVSIASVILRWTLQQHEQIQSTKGVPNRQSATCSSTVVSCRLLPEHLSWDIHRPYTSVNDRLQQLREVIRFTLDDNDIEELWELSNYYADFDQQASNNESNNYYDENLEISTSGLFIPKR